MATVSSGGESKFIAYNVEYVRFFIIYTNMQTKLRKKIAKKREFPPNNSNFIEISPEICTTFLNSNFESGVSK